MTRRDEVFALLAEFDGPEELLAAARATREDGYRLIEAYAPFPVHGLATACGHRGVRLPLAVFLGGVVGAVCGYTLQWWINVVDYPINVGGRPYHSWPSFIPVTFEMTVLFAALTALLAMLGLNKLPQPYHPVFNVDAFEMASRDRFFLLIAADDPRFERSATEAFLRARDPLEVHEVPH